ncbi:MAG: GNAT family N-acetyltransferase [Saprospiraceae bacterium]|nr:GNAT family N-acetyltransferase [Saprospiraceae bacterium]
MDIKILIASADFVPYAEVICEQYAISARDRGTGIATRTPEYIASKMEKGDSVIALQGETLVGFCYIESFENKKYVSNSGLIVVPEFRGKGLAKQIKEVAFNLARDNYPSAQVFGITTSSVVMKINSELGYIPVTYSQLTRDEAFWKGCASCSNYEILKSKEYKMCMCTAMLAPSKDKMTLDLSDRIINQKNEAEQ